MSSNGSRVESGRMARRPKRFVRLEDLIGQRVRAQDGRVAGHIEEVRAERRGDHYEVIEYHLGSGALLERLAVVRHLFGRRAETLIARWDQIDIHNVKALKLTCKVEELKRER